MSQSELIFLAVVVVVALASAWRNLTAAAMVAVYAGVQGSYYATGETLAVRELLGLDMAVIAAIYCKPERPDPWCREPDLVRFRSTWRHVAAFWLEKSVWDRIVLAIFPAVWTVYVTAPTDRFQWWMLYFLSLAQLIAAGIEPFAHNLSPREAKRGHPETPDLPPGAEYAIAGMRGYG